MAVNSRERWFQRKAEEAAPKPKKRPPQKSTGRARGQQAGVTNERLWEALRKSGGLVAPAAEALGVSYQAVSNRVRNDPRWQEAIAEFRAQVTDIAETQMVKGVQRGDKFYVDRWLRYHAKDRGYTTRTEISNPDGSPLQLAPPVDVTIKLIRAPEPKEEEK